MNRFVFKSTQYAMKTKLLHDVKNATFKHEILHAKGNFVIKIQYKIIDGLFVLYHTEVPVEHRGHQLGFLIFQEVIDYLIKHNIQTALYCPFLIKSLKLYPNGKMNIIKKLPTIDKLSF
ncbi:hypothetical protein QTP88_016094 [Uroleucon formosanum]